MWGREAALVFTCVMICMFPCMFNLRVDFCICYVLLGTPFSPVPLVYYRVPQSEHLALLRECRGASAYSTIYMRAHSCGEEINGRGETKRRQHSASISTPSSRAHPRRKGDMARAQEESGLPLPPPTTSRGEGESAHAQ